MKTLKFLKPYTILVLALIAFTLAQVAANLELPDRMARIINEGVVGGNQDLILSVGIEMLFIAFLGGMAAVVGGFIAARVGNGFSRDLRSALFTKIEGFSLEEFNSFSTASLITRSTNDIQQIQMVIVMVLRLVLVAPVTAFWAIVKANQIAPEMNWIMLVAVGCLVSVIATIFILAIPRFEKLQKLTDKLNLVVRESLTGLRVIRAFNNQEIEREKVLQVNTDLTNTNLFVTRVTALLQPSLMLIMNLASIAVIWFGSQLIEIGQLEIGNMLAFMQYAIQVIISFLLISIVFIMLPRALVSIKRVQEVLNTDPSIENPDQPEKSGSSAGLVEFKNVTFGYNNAEAPVLEGITFTAEPGKTTALIGSTGSGKSTLINLIPRFYDVTFGEIMIDGVNIKDLNQEDLHYKIGYVSQKPILFSGTIASNISYGTPDATLDQIKHAAMIAQAAEFIEKLPQGYETSVSQAGANLSGGQKQRISIARAIVKNPDIYIFDDSFSALDFKTDAKLRHQLSEEIKGKTMIIVAQRINTIINAEQIIVFDSGKVVGIGTHKELMRSCNVYQEIAKSQLSDQELSDLS